MKTNRNLAFSLAVLAALSCTRLAEEPLSVSSFDLSVDASAPATKVTFEGTSLVWEGTEEAALIAGSESGYVAAKLLTNEKYPGAFSGSVNLSPYSQDEIKAFAVPYSAASLSGGKLALLIPSNQTQAASGQINGAYVPVYHKLSFADLVLKEDGTYGVENLTLNWGCALLQFNVYGKHSSQSSSETLLSVAITTEGVPAAGTVLCDLASDSMEFEDGAGTLSVSLGEVVPLKGLNQSNGAKLFAAVLPRNVKVIEVTVETDQAIYTMNPAKELSLKPGEVHRIGLDLSKFTDREIATEYSTDGTNWTTAIPSRFSSLQVRGRLSNTTLGKIVSAVKKQTVPADLDLSGTRYESTVFPASFQATSSAPDVSLKSIKFPSNVTEIAEHAFEYCSALESVDLTGIETIGGWAFQYCGLKTLDIPNTVTSIPGTYTFGYNFALQSIYYNSPAPQLSGVNHHTFSTRNTTAVESLPPQYKPGGIIPLEFTFGPDAVAVRQQDFDTNHKLVKMTFKARPEFIGNSWIVRCRYIETFDLSEIDTPPTSDNTSNMAFVGDLVPEGHAKQILVPAGKGEAYAVVNPWKYLSETKGYTIVDPKPPVVAEVLYSTDGTNWEESLPDNFTALYVKGILNSEVLGDIREKFGNLEAGAALDLSQTEYSSEVFPALFGGESEGAGCTTITSIKFPSNVEEIAENAFAYCSALESVELEGIKIINSHAFSSTGLKHLVIPNTVVSMPGQYHFGHCWHLESIYYNSPAPNLKTDAGADATHHTFSTRNTAAVESLPPQYSEGLIPLEYTFGPDAKAVRSQDFDTNHKLVKMTFEAGPEFIGNSWIVRCRYIETFDLSAVDVPPTSANTSNLGAVGDLVPAGHAKQILVPAGKGEDYAAVNPWKYLSENKGYTIVDPQTPVEADVQYSADGSSWSNDIPASFSTLYVKGILTADELSSIKEAIDATTGAGLDMSAAEYSSSTFPAVFGGASKGNNGSADGAVIGTEGSPLTSVKFPSNVTAIADDAFAACSKLASVDLQGIKSIGIGSFKLSGLTAVSVPANVETVGAYAFGYTPALASIYWNSPSTSNHAFSWRGAGDNANNVSSKPTTATFGANTTLATGQTFDTNHKLVKVIFEADPAAIGSAWIIRCTSLASFDLSACTADFPASASSGNLQNVGDDVAEADRIILVPSGSKDAFAAKQPWKYLTETKKYTIQEK
ncbi:MAG: leucine-rich repeat domain-containing protein [Bacteroidales bacterium]|nr:leucine-rich repeat domain-containing protein [Bacteroidales bacterium]